MDVLGVPVSSRQLCVLYHWRRLMPKSIRERARARWLSRPPREENARRGNIAHLQKLREGKEAWNEWRMRAEGAAPQLMGFNLRRMQLQGYDLRNTNMQEAILRGTNLSVRRTSQPTNLRAAILIRADLRQADLYGAWLDHIDTDLRDADMRNAVLTETLFDQVDTRGARGIVLDSTRIWKTRFSATANDPWSRLRRGYTGPKVFMNLLLLIVFLTPYLVKTVGWRCVNKVESVVVESMSRLATVSGGSLSDDEPHRQLRVRLVEELATRAPREENGWRRFAVWELLLGMDKKATFWLTAIALVVYNLLRAALTALVAPLREQEERSGYSPPWLPYTEHSGNSMRRLCRVARHPIGWFMQLRLSYGWMIGPDLLVRVLFLIALVAFLLHLADWLQMDVLLPPIDR